MIYTTFFVLCISSFLASQANPINLNDYEKKIFSQNGEDGIIEKIFELIGITNKYYVEFGVENAKECNTRHLREYKHWSGLLMDGGFENSSINLKQEFITAENINDLFKKYNVPYEFDLLSIDIDFNDFYIWKAIGFNYRPRVVIIEYNSIHRPNQDKIVPYNPIGHWDGVSPYYGASLLACYKLGKFLGYSLVATDKRGINSFFIRNDIIEQLDCKFAHINNVSLLFNSNYKDHLNRPFISSDDVLK